MKALTLCQPWATLIAQADKRYENRVWTPPAGLIKRRIAIHAGKKLLTSSIAGFLMQRYGLDADTLPMGAVVCTAVVTGWVDTRNVLRVHGAVPVGWEDDPWFAGPVGWHLADVRTLREPIPCRGARSLWDLPVDVREAIRLQSTVQAR